MGRWLRRCTVAGFALLLMAVPALAGLPGDAGAFVVTGRPWPGGTISYYNAASDQAWAVETAVRSWNSSGANIRFVATSRSGADVVLTHFTTSACSSPGRLGEATVGYGRHSVVYLNPRIDSSTTCNSLTTAVAVAHELGHVLGLEHETRRCAVMNPHATVFGPEHCSHHGLTWRCHLLTADDVAGAIRLYGGSMTPFSGPEECPMYEPISPPTGLRATSRPDQAALALAFTRPAEPVVPAFIERILWKVSPSGGRSSYAYGRYADRCPDRPSFRAARRIAWRVGVGGSESIYTPTPPRGVYCYVVWAADHASQPSAHPATLLLRID